MLSDSLLESSLVLPSDNSPPSWLLSRATGMPSALANSSSCSSLDNPILPRHHFLSCGSSAPPSIPT